MIRERIVERLQSVFDGFARDIAGLIEQRIEQDLERVNEAMAIALSAFASAGKDDHVEDRQSVRDRAVARDAVPPRAVRIQARAERARSDQRDRAPAVAPKIVRAESEPTPAKKSRAQMKCRNCGAAGFRADGCGTSHQPLNQPAVVGDRDVKPQNVPPEAPPPIARTGSRESKPLHARDKVPASDDEEGPGVELFVTDEPDDPSKPRRQRRGREFARSFTIAEKTSDERARMRLRLGLIDIIGANGEAELDSIRPRIRGDCSPCEGCQAFTDSQARATGEKLSCGHVDALAIRRSRPCVFVGCTKHLYLEVTEAGGLKINFPGVDPLDLVETCSVDRGERGAITLEEVGALTNLTRERVRQIEVKGLHKGRAKAVESGIDQESLNDFPHPEGNHHPDMREGRAERLAQRVRESRAARREAAAEPTKSTESEES